MYIWLFAGRYLIFVPPSSWHVLTLVTCCSLWFFFGYIWPLYTYGMILLFLFYVTDKSFNFYYLYYLYILNKYITNNMFKFWQLHVRDIFVYIYSLHTYTYNVSCHKQKYEKTKSHQDCLPWPLQSKLNLQLINNKNQQIYIRIYEYEYVEKDHLKLVIITVIKMCRVLWCWHMSWLITFLILMYQRNKLFL